MQYRVRLAVDEKSATGRGRVSASLTPTFRRILAFHIFAAALYPAGVSGRPTPVPSSAAVHLGRDDVAGPATVEPELDRPAPKATVGFDAVWGTQGDDE